MRVHVDVQVALGRRAHDTVGFLWRKERDQTIRSSSQIPVPAPTVTPAYLFCWRVTGRRVLGTLLIFVAAKLTAAAVTTVVGAACTVATSTVYSGMYLTQGGEATEEKLVDVTTSKSR